MKREHEEPLLDPEDDLRTFRGMFWGSVIGLLFWAVILVLWRVFL